MISGSIEKGRQGWKEAKSDNSRSCCFHPSHFCRAHFLLGKARALVLYLLSLNPGPADVHTMAMNSSSDPGLPYVQIGGPESPLSGLLLWTELCSPQNLCFEALIPNVAVFGDRTSKNVIKVK